MTIAEVYAGNLRLAHDRVTATFVCPMDNVEHASDDTSTIAFWRWAGALNVLDRPFQLDVIDRLVPISATMNRMVASVPGGWANLHNFPAYRNEMQIAAQMLQNLEVAPGEQMLLVSIDLKRPAPRTAGELAVAASSAISRSGPVQPDPEVLAAMLAESAELRDQLVNLLPGTRPATSGELQWLDYYYCTFGGVEPPYTHPDWTDSHDKPVRSIPFGNVEFNVESRLPRRKRTASGRTAARMLTIDSPVMVDRYLDSAPEGGERQRVYQAMLVLDRHPHEWSYPSEAMGVALNRLSCAWTLSILVTPESAEKAQRATDRQFKSLHATAEESSGDSTPHLDVELAVQVLGNEKADLVLNKSGAFKAVVIVRLAAASAAELNQAVKKFSNSLDRNQVHFHRVPGHQTALWMAARPGGVRHAILSSYERTYHAIGLAALAFFHGSTLGDERGPIWGFNADTHKDGRPRLVHRDFRYGLREDEGSVGAAQCDIGEQGGGKTYGGKVQDKWALALGAKVVILDPSSDKEFPRAALAWTHAPVTVINPNNEAVSWDPLRVFSSNLSLAVDSEAAREDRELAERHTLRYLAIRLSVPEDDPRYDLLEGAVTGLLRGDPTLKPSMPNLVTLLGYRAGILSNDVSSEDPAHIAHAALASPELRARAAELIQKLDNLSNSATGRALFSTAAPINLGGSGVLIFQVPGLKLDSAANRATVYLIQAYMIRSMSATRAFTLIHLPELKGISSDPWGRQIHDDALRVARRENSGVLADTQLARDVPDGELFLVRTAGRTKTESGAISALAFVGMPITTDRITRLRSLPTGAKAILDSHGRSGWIDSLGALLDTEHQLYRTDPGRHDADGPEAGDGGVTGPQGSPSSELSLAGAGR